MSRKIGKIGKIDFKKSIKNTAVAVGTGAVVQVLTQSVLPDDPQTQDIGLIVLGALLPEFVKMPEMEVASTAMIGIASYRFAERNDLAGKLGITTDPTATSGIPSQNVVGNAWIPAKNISEKQSKSNQNSDAVRTVIN